LSSDGTIWENDGYDTAQYTTIRNDMAPKCSIVFNGQQSKINAAFSLTPSHTFACIRTPSTVDSIQTPSITQSSNT